MRTVLPDHGSGWQDVLEPAAYWQAGPWSVRLAGVRSACPALELYEADVLLDVVSATRIAPQSLRGARSFACAAGRYALAWGRLPGPGTDLVVEFSRGLRRHVLAAEAVPITAWCWLAVADGHFRRVDVRAGGEGVRRSLAGGRPCR
jgi:hypothetical protein